MEDVAPLYMPTVDFSASYNEAAEIASDIQRTTGAFDYLSGSSDSGGASATATGVATITNEGNKRVEEQIKVFHHQMVRFGYLLLQNMLQWLPDEVAINFSRSPRALEAWNKAQGEWTANHESSLVSIPGEDLQPVGRLMPIPQVGADKRMTDLQRRSDMMQTAQAVAPFLGVPGAINVPAFLRWMLDQVGIDQQTREEILTPDMGQVMATMPQLQPGQAPPPGTSGPSGDNAPSGAAPGGPVTGPSGSFGMSPDRGSANTADLGAIPVALRPR